MPHLSNRRRTEIGKLSRRKYRKKFGQTLVEGSRAVISAVEGGAPLVDILITRYALQQKALAEALRQVEVPIYQIGEDELAAVSELDSPQEVIAVVQRRFVPPEEWRAFRTMLLLDRVQDPGNVGTLLRTAAWFGVEAVIGIQGTAGFFHPKVMRAAMGAHWDLKLARVKSVSVVREEIGDENVSFVGADLKGIPLSAWHPSERVMLLMGSEAHGLSSEARDLVDQCISIHGNASPRKSTESLNVAISAGIIMHAWLAR